jgi:acyl carrier protein
MAKRDDLPNELIALFVEQLQVEVPSASTDLIEAGLLDSPKFVELLLCLEQKFGMRWDLNELELDHFRSVQRISELVWASRHDIPRS